MKEDKSRIMEAAWQYELTKVFFAVIRKYPDGFTADQIFQELNQSKAEIPPNYVSRSIGALFKSFKASGYIIKTGNYRLSERNGSSPLPLYKSANNAVVSNDNSKEGKTN